MHYKKTAEGNLKVKASSWMFAFHIIVLIKAIYFFNTSGYPINHFKITKQPCDTYVFLYYAVFKRYPRTNVYYFVFSLKDTKKK